MYVIISQKQSGIYRYAPVPIEVVPRLQIAKDRCRTLNKAAMSNRYSYKRVKPILDASGTKADPSQISF